MNPDWIVEKVNSNADGGAWLLRGRNLNYEEGHPSDNFSWHFYYAASFMNQPRFDFSNAVGQDAKAVEFLNNLRTRRELS